MLEEEGSTWICGKGWKDTESWGHSAEKGRDGTYQQVEESGT